MGQSIERRFDRYRVLYARKIILGLVPSMGVSISNDSNHRLGRKLNVPRYKSKIKQDSFAVRGPESFNSLPLVLRNMECSMETFKTKLDEFLSIIPDKPRIDAGCKLYSNSLKNQVYNWRWKTDLSIY